MKIHQLATATTKPKKRVGRGIGSGYGKTAGRGTKGQKARTGGNIRPGFEGGQNPLAKRLPKKRGFTARNHTTYQVVNLDRLEIVKTATIDVQALQAVGLVKSLTKPVKLLGSTKLERKLTIKVQAISGSARVAVESAGGTIELLSLPTSPKKPTRPTQTA